MARVMDHDGGMRIAHCQFEPWVGDFEHNLGRFAEGLARADQERAAIVSFPECFLTGYPDDGAVALAGGFAADGEKMARVLDVTSRQQALAVVGFNEVRGADLYNSAAIVHAGHLLGIYSKCAAYMSFHKQGREFPVFEHQGLRFGVLICADGGYIEPARILAMKGARLIVAPHFNYISDQNLLTHFMKVRADHTARAIENSVYFLRGNNVVLDHAKSGMTSTRGVGYGDSYVIDPQGEIVARSRRHREDFLVAEIDPTIKPAMAWGLTKSAWSQREFGAILAEAAAEQSRA
jgi:predicted amidohydrolase